MAGSHFLWRMVRRVVGVLIAVGRREMRIEEVSRLLDEQSNVPATLTAPPSELFLERVFYRGDPPPTALEPIVFGGARRTRRV